MEKTFVEDKTQLSLIDLIDRYGLGQSDQLAYQWLEDGEDESESLTFGELRSICREMHSGLLSVTSGNLHQRPIILMFSPSLTFLKALFGCMYSGAIAVPVSVIKPRSDPSKLLNVIGDSGATTILVDEASKETLKEYIVNCGIENHISVYSVSDIQELAKDLVPELTLDINDTALYQYTSGSTGTPKGVEITHANIVTNQQMIKEGFGHTAETVFVGWLPLYHDMGLIGNVMQPLYLGIPCYLMSPFSFIQKPIRWLKAISKYRATTSGGPNFGYDLCVQRVKEAACEDLDLSSWKVAFNGSEPVKSETLDEFSAKFSAYGFSSKAHYPCYGMAESTLFISGADSSAAHRVLHLCKEKLSANEVVVVDTDFTGQTIGVVSCGKPSSGQKISIVDPDILLDVADGAVGEIWIQGENIAKSYVNKPELTSSHLRALKLSDDSKTYLRTGDLGFIFEGELFVTGRIKDVIIVRGKNHYPHDIEKTVARTSPAFNDFGNAAVYSSAKEQLIVLQEVEREYLRKIDIKELTDQAKIAVGQNHDLALSKLILLKPNSLPKTTSGKIRRKECLDRYLKGQLEDRILIMDKEIMEAL